MDQTADEFVVELEELVEKIFAGLDGLRAAKGEAQVERRLLDQIFRNVHSVKGLAGSAELPEISRVAHLFESLLDGLRTSRLMSDDRVLELCEEAANALSVTTSAPGEPSREELIERLEGFLRVSASETSEVSESVLNALGSPFRDSLNSREKEQLANVVNRGQRLFQLRVCWDKNNYAREFHKLKGHLAKCGEVISTLPSVDSQEPDKINFLILYAGEGAEGLEESIKNVPHLSFQEIPTTTPVRSPGFEESSEVDVDLPAVSLPPTFVRADLEKLDHLISTTHDLFKLTNGTLDVALSQNEINSNAWQELNELSEQVRNSFLRVEEELINLRMVALEPTLRRAVRAGRAAARRAGKEIDFEIRGAAIRVDKLVAGALGDSLVHLVRNAVDHGIESAPERARAGKNRRGTIAIEAVNEGSQTRLRVTDDGRGIDPKVISVAALRLGLVEKDHVLDLERSLRLIFRPGFTTLESANELSGRGVGLDVVESAVEQVGGGLRVSSKANEGSTFEILLPVTFGLLQATVIRSAGESYCIPSMYVLDGEAKDLEQPPIVSLRNLLGQESVDSRALQSVACEVPQFGLVRLLVDEVVANEEVLVRNLGRYAGRWYAVAGGAHLRDESVALVLDLPRLMNAVRSEHGNQE